MKEPLLSIENLTVSYDTPNGTLTAVSGASFEIGDNEFFGLVGESGSGKSTLAKAIIHGLDENGEIANGTISYQGEEIQNLSEEGLNERIRWKEISWIPQSSMNSLDPLMSIKEQGLKLARAHSDLSDEEAVERLEETFEVVGLQPGRISDYPHQFSGGMRQRALIVLAIFLRPSLIIADEPTTALDVIMQDQILKYIEGIQDSNKISMLLITHDISVVLESCSRMGVMHAGQLAEVGTTKDLYYSPHHPYSILLQEAFPDHRYPDQELATIDGAPPLNFGKVDYCTFEDRCPWAIEECGESAPALERLSSSQGRETQFVSCFRKSEVPELYEESKRE